MTPEARITLERILQDVREINDYFKSGKVQEAALKTLGHTTGIIIRLERELSAPSPAPEVMGTPEVRVEFASPPQAPDRYEVRIGKHLIHCFEYEFEAEKLAKNLRQAVAQPDPWVDVKVGLPTNHDLVLVYRESSTVSVGWHHVTAKRWYMGHTRSDGTYAEQFITHWRELPAPPETRATEGK